MTPLSSFTSRVAPHALTAPDVLIEQAVLDTCIDFCERTLIVRATLDPFNTSPGVQEYDLEATDSSLTVARLMRAWLGTQELRPWSEDQVSDPFAFQSSVTGYTRPTGTPNFFDEPEPGTIGFYPAPDAAYPVAIRAALKPLRSATVVPDVLFENWANAIADGALARIFTMPAYLQANLAGAHQALYVAAANAAALEARRGRNRAEQRVRPVWI